MREILVKTPTAENGIRIGKGCVQELGALLSGSKNFLLIDETVYGLYADKFDGYFAENEIFILPAGEENKNFRVLENILARMLEACLDRSSKLVVVGGGVVGDIGGLAASLYMRGISYIQIPTTLLAQIDSSVGGKTAVDLSGVKNAVGTFYQAEVTLIDPLFLKTLPDSEWKSGFGELVKYAGLNSEIFRILEENSERVMDGDERILTALISACVAHKAGVVERDEKDEGERKSLNLGHTTAHALELSFKLSHGESVLYGLALETLYALHVGVCEKGYGERYLSLVQKFLNREPRKNIDLSCVEEWTKTAKFDKKNSQNKITLVVTKNVGEWTGVELSFDEYLERMRASVQSL
jgi:3-dehydroquinate synthase